MFTGIIEATAEVIKNQDGELIVRRPGSFDDLKRGSSVCVSGACLTVTKLAKKEMTFDVVPETLKRTTLGSKKEGELVNLERALSASGRFDGHVVQGHVEGVGVVVSVSSIPQPLSPGGKGEGSRRGLTPSGMLKHSREMRSNPTEAEEMFWEAVRHDKLGVRFRRQYRMGVHIVDFYIPSFNIAVELDGGYHKTEAQAKQDEERTAYLGEVFGAHVLRFENDHILKDLPHVIDTLLSVISASSQERASANDSPSPPERGLGGEGGKEYFLTIRSSKDILSNLVPKGSVTLDGVSLTVVGVSKHSFSVALIPITIQQTTLGLLRKGDRVNIESDILGRYVHQFLSSRP